MSILKITIMATDNPNKKKAVINISANNRMKRYTRH